MQQIQLKMVLLLLEILLLELYLVSLLNQLMELKSKVSLDSAKELVKVYLALL